MSCPVSVDQWSNVGSQVTSEELYTEKVSRWMEGMEVIDETVSNDTNDCAFEFDLPEPSVMLDQIVKGTVEHTNVVTLPDYIDYRSSEFGESGISPPASEASRKLIVKRGRPLMADSDMGCSTEIDRNSLHTEAVNTLTVYYPLSEMVETESSVVRAEHYIEYNHYFKRPEHDKLQVTDNVDHTDQQPATRVRDDNTGMDDQVDIIVSTPTTEKFGNYFGLEVFNQDHCTRSSLTEASINDTNNQSHTEPMSTENFVDHLGLEAVDQGCHQSTWSPGNARNDKVRITSESHDSYS